MKVTTHEMIMGNHLVVTRDVQDDHVNVYGAAKGSLHYIDVWLPEAAAVALLGECEWLRSKTHTSFGAKFSRRGE